MIGNITQDTDLSENSRFSPPNPSILYSRVVHYFHHPFWGKHPYFWKHPYTVLTSYNHANPAGHLDLGGSYQFINGKNPPTKSQPPGLMTTRANARSTPGTGGRRGSQTQTFRKPLGFKEIQSQQITKKNTTPHVLLLVFGNVAV